MLMILMGISRKITEGFLPRENNAHVPQDNKQVNGGMKKHNAIQDLKANRRGGVGDIPETEAGHLRNAAIAKYLVGCDETERSCFLKRPSIMLNVHVFKDGDMWCASLKNPRETCMMETVTTFGKTPDKACEAFDKLWMEGRGE